MGGDCERRRYSRGKDANGCRKLNIIRLICGKGDGLRARHVRQELEFGDNVRAAFYCRGA